MITALFTSMLNIAYAETVSQQWSGRFQISGFSFTGSVPGTITFGPDNQSQIALVRPSGIPIMSVTILSDQVCFQFDMDDVQYRGTLEEFAALSDNALPAHTIPLLFSPDMNVEPNAWTWQSTPKQPVRKLTIESNDALFLQAKYPNWTKDNTRPKRLSIQLEPNMWTLRANFKEVSEVPWTATCEGAEDIQVQPLTEMLKSIPKK